MLGQVCATFFAGRPISDFLKFRGPVEVCIRAQLSSAALIMIYSLDMTVKTFLFFLNYSCQSCKFAKIPRFDKQWLFILQISISQKFYSFNFANIFKFLLWTTKFFRGRREFHLAGCKLLTSVLGHRDSQFGNFCYKLYAVIYDAVKEKNCNYMYMIKHTGEEYRQV